MEMSLPFSMITLMPWAVGVLFAPSDTENTPYCLPSVVTVILCVDASTTEMLRAPVEKSRVRLLSNARPLPADTPLVGMSMCTCACAGQYSFGRQCASIG